MAKSANPRFHNMVSRGVFGLILLLLVAGLSAALLLLPLPTSINTIPLSQGDVAAEDILAPRALSYQSEVLTEHLREDAASAVAAQYTSPDANIARQQMSELRDVLNFITSVRADSYATEAQQISDLAQIQAVHLQEGSARNILQLSDTDWQTVRLETISVVEQTMRGTIREDRLEEARRSIPSLVSFTLQEDQTALVVELASAFVTPNSLYSEEMTEEQREIARQAVEPTYQAYVAGETIVPRGHVITESDLEALQQFGLLETETTWEDTASVLALVAINFIFIFLYFAQRPDLRRNPTSLLLMAILFLLFMAGGRLIIPNRTIVPYMFPLAGFGMVVAALISSRAAIILSLPLSILVAYGLPNSYELTLFYIFGCAFGILMLRNVHRLLSFYWAGLGVALAGATVLLAFRLNDPLLDAVGFVQLISASGFNGLAAATITLLLQFLLAQILGLTTTLQLLEISRPDHPLLQNILRNAPGTYQHSLQIANLAEQAAERIGADTLLTRVGSLYHDAGKVRYPQFFIENQVPGYRNPHDDLTPENSAAIIIQHVPDGLEIVKKHRLPKRIQDFVLEHHGTMMTRYQYHKALKAVDGDTALVDKSLYTYPGPKPQSRETALVMLADGVEARARAERPDTEDAVHTLVREIVEDRLATDQLSDTELTLQDLNEIIDSFTTTLRGVYHPRIEYPKPDASVRPGITQEDTVPRETPPEAIQPQ